MRSCNHCYSGKAISITEYVCVFVACPAVQYFATRHDLKKQLLSKKCVF